MSVSNTKDVSRRISLMRARRVYFSFVLYLNESEIVRAKKALNFRSVFAFFPFFGFQCWHVSVGKKSHSLSAIRAVTLSRHVADKA